MELAPELDSKAERASGSASELALESEWVSGLASELGLASALEWASELARELE